METQVFYPSTALLITQHQIQSYFAQRNVQSDYIEMKLRFDEASKGGELRSIIEREDLRRKPDPEQSRRQRLYVLDRLGQQFNVPEYHAANRHSPRINAHGRNRHACWLSLGRACRKRLLRGFRQADLASSQMSILASYLQIPELVQFFATGQSLWDYLQAQTGYPRELIRSVAKPLLYGIPFGMQQETLVRRAHELQISKLLEVDIIPLMLQKRDEAYRRIEQDARGSPQGMVSDLVGSWHRFHEVSSSETHYLQPELAYDYVRKNQYVAKNILACQIQSIELLIMGQLAPLFPQADVKAWIHDAIVFGHHDPLLEAQMQSAIQSCAQHFPTPIYTRLEFETL